MSNSEKDEMSWRTRCYYVEEKNKDGGHGDLERLEEDRGVGWKGWTGAYLEETIAF